MLFGDFDTAYKGIMRSMIMAGFFTTLFYTPTRSRLLKQVVGVMIIGFFSTCAAAYSYSVDGHAVVLALMSTPFFGGLYLFGASVVLIPKWLGWLYRRVFPKREKAS